MPISVICDQPVSSLLQQIIKANIAAEVWKGQERHYVC